MITQTAVFANGLQIELIESPVYKQYYYALHKYQIGQSFPSNRPETSKDITNVHYSNLTESYQRGWLKLNTAGNEPTDKEISAWLSYTAGNAFITNAKGTETNANYITGERLNMGYPGIMSIFCLGNVLCGDEITLNNVKYLHPETMNGNEPFDTTKTRMDNPEIIHVATIYTTSQLSDKTYKVNPFPHLGGRVTGRSVFYPFVSRFTVLYPMRYLLKLPMGMLPLVNPYNPPMLEA